MREIHPDVAGSAKEVVIKESKAYRVRLEKWESVSPKGLFSIDIIQEMFDDKGEVAQSSTYNFHMTKDELEKLAHGLTL